MTARARALPAGFTLIELMVAVAIIATLATIAVPYYLTSVRLAQNVAAEQEMRLIAKDISIYQLGHCMSLPATLDEIGHGARLDPWGRPYQYLSFEHLTTGQSGNSNGGSNGNGNGNGGNQGNGQEQGSTGCNGQKRKDKNLVPINSDYDLYSLGPDGRSVGPLTAKHSHDDIIRANDGGYFGVASAY